ncbi:MAG: glycosyltransferase family 4 protein [Sedimentisphaerales bacterium]|nr:glycosyltransferase family 4 protein [Sedimentisphaerales bacterium]
MTPANRPIKICFISPKAYPLFNADVKEVFGGAEVDLYFLSRELARDKDFEVSFITADYGQEKTEMIEDVRIIKSLDFKENPLTGAIKVWRAMRAADAEIYFREAPSSAGFLLALFCKLNRRIFVYRTASKGECDGWYLKQHPLGGRAFLWSLRKAALVVVQNETDKAEISRTTGISAVVIPNAHPLPALSQGQRDIVLWVGRSTPLKRPGLFIDLAEQMPDENFTMICQRATGDNDFQALAQRAEKVKNLKFINRVPFHETASHYQRAKLFVNTSDSEGFPNTFVEACKHAAAILSLSINPDGFLTTYKCGLCADDDWRKFLEQFEFLTASQEARDYGRNGRRYAEEKHDIEKIVKRYKELFSALTARSGAGDNQTEESN